MKLLAKADWFKQKKTDEEEDPGDAKNAKKGRCRKRFKKAGKEGEVACRLDIGNFTRENKDKGPTTVMFVPWTVNGLLVKALKAGYQSRLVSG